MAYVLSVDPGLNHCGTALWTSDGALVSAWLSRSGKDTTDDLGTRTRAVATAIGSGAIDRVIIERPQIYRHSPGDPNDLINLAIVVGCVVQITSPAEVISYLPRQWKGTTKKDIMVAHIQKCLSLDEKMRVDTKPKSLAHNVWDAVGLGLFYFGRL